MMRELEKAVVVLLRVKSPCKNRLPKEFKQASKCYPDSSVHTDYLFVGAGLCLARHFTIALLDCIAIFVSARFTHSCWWWFLFLWMLPLALAVIEFLPYYHHSTSIRSIMMCCSAGFSQLFTCFCWISLPLMISVIRYLFCGLYLVVHSEASEFISS